MVWKMLPHMDIIIIMPDSYLLLDILIASNNLL